MGTCCAPGSLPAASSLPGVAELCKRHDGRSARRKGGAAQGLRAEGRLTQSHCDTTGSRSLSEGVRQHSDSWCFGEGVRQSRGVWAQRPLPAVGSGSSPGTWLWRCADTTCTPAHPQAGRPCCPRTQHWRRDQGAAHTANGLPGLGPEPLLWAQSCRSPQASGVRRVIGRGPPGSSRNAPPHQLRCLTLSEDRWGPGSFPCALPRVSTKFQHTGEPSSDAQHLEGPCWGTLVFSGGRDRNMACSQ